MGEGVPLLRAEFVLHPISFCPKASLSTNCKSFRTSISVAVRSGHDTAERRSKCRLSVPGVPAGGFWCQFSPLGYYDCCCTRTYRTYHTARDYSRVYP